MSAIDLAHLCTWIGKSHVDEDVIGARHARLMAATVDHPDPGCIRDGEPLPPLWHWIYFLDGLPPDKLGCDGHPARGGFLPPVPLANRMWAGGRLSFLAPVLIGARVRKTSRVLTVDHKAGRAGDLVFVTVLHELAAISGEPLIREEHDIVYKDASPPSPDAGRAEPLPADARCRSFVPTSTTLFRYSALTFNGHRIHYDQDYCREVEGYANLVIHGPLTATLLAAFATEASGRELCEFSYRGLRPALLGDRLAFSASIDGDFVSLMARLGDGATCMQAKARLAQSADRHQGPAAASRGRKQRYPEIPDLDVDHHPLGLGERGVPAPARAAQPATGGIGAVLVTEHSLQHENLFAPPDGCAG